MSDMDGITRQERLFGERERDFGTIRAENARLYPFVAAANAIVGEAKLDPTDGGLRIRAVDSANVCMVDVSVSIDGAVPDETVGVDLSGLAGRLQNKPREATVTVDCALPHGLLRLEEEFANGRVWNVRERVGMIDPDMTREHPGELNGDFDITVTVAREELSTLVSRLPSNRPVELRTGDGELSLGAITSGPDDPGEYRALATTEYEDDGEARAIYSHEYLEQICAGCKAAGAETLSLSWADEFPLSIKGDGEHVTVEYGLAPRVMADA